ncbi:MAG: 3-hydroxy-5-phosphonooxypentane-2,4-dione thiolase [Planctomycetes bacterium]|nr:3-hydroxy-5-phosphonooxypentane-2,4-dione thiolase [Planctomycetota bacterium]
MPEADAAPKERKDFAVKTPQKEIPAFYLRGTEGQDWGLKSRMARIFNPESGRTVMLAFDHGYLYGPTTGLERMDLAIIPLLPYVDVLMCTRGALRQCIPPECGKPVCLRSSGGATILKEMSHEMLSVAVDDAVRLDAAAVTCQVYVGGEKEHETLRNLSQLINEGLRYGIPTLGVTAVGRELARDSRYLGLATRVIAEYGAHFVKTYYCAENFDEVAAGCPIPIVIAGGKKLPELDALKMCHNAVQQGALGVDMGRNIFQADDPVAMVQAVRAVVHGGETPEKALDLYNTLKSEGRKTRKAR